MAKRYSIIGATICSLAGQLTVSFNVTAYAAECLAAPNAQSPPGAHWRYRIDQATSQRCWYLKDLRGSRSASEGPATTSAPSGAGSEPAQSAAPAESESSITAWFSSKIAALTGVGRSSSSTETREPPASAPSVTRKRQDSERTELRRPQPSKSEQEVKSEQSKSEQNKSEQSKSEQNKSEQSKSEQSKSEREQAGVALARERLATLFARILEAAGDKLVPDPMVELTEEAQIAAIEAVGEKDVITPRIDLEEDWQKALYEEFLVWRSKQVMLQEAPTDLARDDHRR